MDRRETEMGRYRATSLTAAVAMTLLTAAVAMTLLTIAPAEADDPPDFADIDGTTHEDAVVAIADEGIAAGFPDGTFRPRDGVSRGQMAAFVARALELPPGDASGVDDVAGTTHEEAIGSVVGAGIASGFPDGTFRPRDTVTRGQMATMLSAGFDLDADETLRFHDVAGTTHEAGIGAVASAGITAGVSDGIYAPRATVTRGQMATFLARGLELIDRVTPPPEVLERDPDLDVAVTLTEVASMDSPTAGAAGPDGTVYLAERAGTVHPLSDDGVGGAVIDLSGETTTENERGLLGLAFAADGRELYLSYTDAAGDTAVDGVAVEDGAVQADQRRTIYTLEQPAANHNGGDLAVGPDGMLYLGLGDGGGSGDPQGAGQDLSTPLGSLVRIDPQDGDPYAIPDDNPFVDTDGAASEIYAYGLRNPWRFSFDGETGDLWIADVGESTREEINRVTLEQARGANFGWNLMEGTSSFAGSEPDDHVPPVYEYDTRGPEGCAITGGYVYTGEAIPQLRGAYLYADYCVGQVRGLVIDHDGEVIDQAELGIDGGQVVSFVEDGAGELYVLDLGGTVHRIDPA